MNFYLIGHVLLIGCAIKQETPVVIVKIRFPVNLQKCNGAIKETQPIEWLVSNDINCDKINQKTGTPLKTS